jgi:phospholipid N-methyltransferase
LRQTGSLFRSSKNLAEKLVIPLTSNSQINIIELGAGDGIITKHILKKVNQACTVHSFEINQPFIFKLKKIKDERLIIYNTCVSNIKTQFSRNEIDFVISSLPLANIKLEFKKELIDVIKHVLKPEGKFIQYQYSKRDLRLLENNFYKTDVSLCIKNLPPAFIYYCTNN